MPEADLFGNLTNWQKELAVLICAKTPIISIATYEEWRFLDQLKEVRRGVLQRQSGLITGQLSRTPATADERLQKLQKKLEAQRDRLAADESHPIIRWSSSGLENCLAEPRPSCISLPPPYRDGEKNPVEVFRFLRDSAGWLEWHDSTTKKPQKLHVASGLFVFCDLYPYLDRDERQSRYNHTMVRMLRDLAHLIRGGDEPSTIILLSPSHCVPSELRMDSHVMEFPLPSQEDLRTHYESFKQPIKDKYGDKAMKLESDQLDALLRAMSGLTVNQAGNVIRKGLAERGVLDSKLIKQAVEEKAQIIRKDGILEVIGTDINLTDDVGGLELLRHWLEQRHRGFQHKTYPCGDDGKDRRPLPVPKGMLIVGVPGCGKSLVAKATAAAWGGLPLLRLEVGRIFGQYVGESEKNINRAIHIAEVVAPCILWVDEIEKCFPKTSGSGDSGTSLRVLNVFLTWLQEKTAQVFVVATANDITLMPTEITRKGRFDEIFYVGLPDQNARKDILRIHTQKAGFTLDEMELNDLAACTKCFTGAEIEQAVDGAKHLVGQVSPPPGTRPFVAAMRQCIVSDPNNPAMPVIVPLAKRTTEDGRLLLQKTHDSAVQIATAASAHFEPLPGEQERARRISDDVFTPRLADNPV